ncbi:MAG: energy transducer TonB, partial [Bacteroidota bacterium]
VVYPSMAREAGIEGQVVVQFIVDEEGNVTDPVVLRSPADILSQAALEAVNASRFTPARQQGRAVKVRFAVPVTFRLPSGDGEDRGSRMERDNGPAIFYDVSYSNDLERFVDHSTSLATRSRASLMARVAAGDSPFRDLRPGTARLRFRVQDNGRMLILGDVEGDSDTLERFARFHALGTEFEPGAAGLEGEMVVSVTRVS